MRERFLCPTPDMKYVTYLYVKTLPAGTRSLYTEA
jgi:hypothetical protein